MVEVCISTVVSVLQAMKSEDALVVGTSLHGRNTM